MAETHVQLYTSLTISIDEITTQVSVSYTYDYNRVADDCLNKLISFKVVGS